jgi:hypothetical protein
MGLLHLVATVIDACGRQPDRGPGHPPAETVRVVATLRRFLREGTPWRGLTATEDQASGSRGDRAALAAALAFLRPGDCLVVWKLDRLGRSLPHLLGWSTASRRVASLSRH